MASVSVVFPLGSSAQDAASARKLASDKLGIDESQFELARLVPMSVQAGDEKLTRDSEIAIRVTNTDGDSSSSLTLSNFECTLKENRRLRGVVDNLSNSLTVLRQAYARLAKTPKTHQMENEVKALRRENEELWTQGKDAKLYLGILEDELNKLEAEVVSVSKRARATTSPTARTNDR